MTSWVWDGDVVLHELRSGRDEPAAVTTWLFEPETFTPVGKIAPDQSCYSVVSNFLGAPSEMHDESGVLAWQAQLDVNGVPRMQHGRRADCPWRLPGQQEDEESGLFYNRFRRYAPWRGDYISKDPLGLNGGLGSYAYPANPINWIDPFGLHAVQGWFTPAGGTTTRPVLNPNQGGTNLWPNTPGSGGNGMAPSGFGRLGDSENHLLDHLATSGQDMRGGVLSVNAVTQGGHRSLPPCPSCDAGMQAFADRFGVTVVYTQGGRNGHLRGVGNERVYRPREEGDPPSGGNCRR